MKKFLDIHLEAMDDEGEKLKRIIDENIPCAISLCPETLRKKGLYSKQYPYLPKYIDLIGEIVSREGSILGQQGNLHKCRYEHRFTDPWHENFCPYNEVSMEEQRELMLKGRQTLVMLFGKYPEMYVPPNHLFDSATLVIAERMDYSFFAERGIKNTEPYLYKRMIILPETKLDETGDIKYVHYDEIGRNKKAFEEVVKKACGFSINEIKIKWVVNDLIEANRRAVIRKKKLRDLIKFPKRILEK